MILDGKKVRNEILDELKKKISKEKMEIVLAIVLVGDNPASLVYVNNKIKYSSMVGIKTKFIHLKEDTTEEDVIKELDKLNKNKSITGIILQNPVPRQINYDNCIKHISPEKDVDGFTSENLYNMVHNLPGLRPCTAKGIIRLLKYYDIDLNGKYVCLIGRGDTAGKPLYMELLNENATVSICHSYTKNLKDITKCADIVISAVGKPKFITKDMIKKGAVVVDVGISVIDGNQIGDVDFLNVKKKSSYITPNPGGVGPMTIAMIIENVVDAYVKGRDK